MAQDSDHFDHLTTSSSSRLSSLNEDIKNEKPQRRPKERKVMFSKSAILKSESFKTQITSKVDSSQSLSCTTTVDPPFSLDGE